MKVKVKICGIRSLETAEAAIAAGADFIGFNFVPSSKRYIDPEVCQKIIDHIKGKIKIVGVFRDSSFTEVNDIAKRLDLDYVQLHGHEDDSYIKQIELPVIKSLHEAGKRRDIKAEFLLLDRADQGKGKMVELNFAKHLAGRKEIFFAGGLTPDTVASVIAYVKPFAVDVAGGVETNGKEDNEKIKLFIRNAKGAVI
jgi:phosphoribosylanthranilate isomerase